VLDGFDQVIDCRLAWRRRSPLRYEDNVHGAILNHGCGFSLTNVFEKLIPGFS
jgi:hypothetical protein